MNANTAFAAFGSSAILILCNNGEASSDYAQIHLVDGSAEIKACLGGQALLTWNGRPKFCVELHPSAFIYEKNGPITGCKTNRSLMYVFVTSDAGDNLCVLCEDLQGAESCNNIQITKCREVGGKPYGTDDSNAQCFECGAGQIAPADKCRCTDTTKYVKDWTCTDCPRYGYCDGLALFCNDDLVLIDDICRCPEDDQFFDGECKTCPDHASCDGLEVSCNHDLQFLDGVCICQSINEYFDESQCKQCPDRATCDGFAFTCHDHLTFKNGICQCASDNFYDKGNLCLACIDHATCDGLTKKCNEDFESFNNLCVCEGKVLKYFDETCQDCPERAECDGLEFQCLSGFILENYQCICKKDGIYQFVNGDGECQDCVDYATCNGTNIKCKGELILFGEECRCEAGKWMVGDQCRDCPERGICDGTVHFQCQDGFVNNSDGNMCVCGPNHYLWCIDSNDICQICPDYATCDDGLTFVCKDDFTQATDSCTCPNGFIKDSLCNSCEDDWTCDGKLIIQCQNNQLLASDGLSCDPCPDEQICDGSTKSEACPQYGACKLSILSCNDGFDQTGNEQCSCNDDFYITPEQTCEECPEDHECDKNEIIKCLDGMRLVAPNQCVECDENMVCDGGEEAESCPDFGKCEGGVLTCNKGFKQVNNACSCDSSNFIDNSKECIACPTNGQCDGTKDLTCPSLYEKTQNGQRCTCADSNYIDDDDQCQPCPKTCQDHLITNCGEDQLVVAGQRSCQTCDDNTVCDGANVTGCADGFKFGNTRKDMCIKCVDTICKDGVDQGCPVNGKCDGKALTGCVNGFELAELRDVKVCKQIPSQVQGCGVICVVAVVLSLICLVSCAAGAWWFVKKRNERMIINKESFELKRRQTEEMARKYEGVMVRQNGQTQEEVGAKKRRKIGEGLQPSKGVRRTPQKFVPLGGRRMDVE